jgi:hypothetical protein
MTNATFLWNNLWDSGTLTQSSQHSNFPATNTRRRWATESWRSMYGSGTGGGYFVITAGVNDDIDFEETNGVELTATLGAGVYTADELATEMETQLEASGASNYTVGYNHSTLKFTLASDRAGGGGVFKLLWSSGSHSATTAGDTIGFDITEDDADSASHTGDYVRIHSEEWLKLDKASAVSFQAFALKYHNLQSTATAKIQAHTSDSWGTPDIDVSLSITADVIIYFWTSSQSKRWIRYKVNDVDNDDGYTEAGRLFLGTYFSPTGNFRRDYRKGYLDPSDLIFSDGGQISSNQKTKYRTYELVFEYTSDDDLETFEDMWDSRGFTKEIFFTRDRDNASTTTMYARVVDMGVDNAGIADDLFHVRLVVEELR